MYLIKNNYFHTMHDIFLFTYYLSNDNGISVKKKKKAAKSCRYPCITNFKFVCSVAFSPTDYDLITATGPP